MAQSECEIKAPRRLMIAGWLQMGLMVFAPAAAWIMLLVRQILWPAPNSHRLTDFWIAAISNTGLLLVGVLLSWLVWRAVMKGSRSAIELSMVGVALAAFVSFSATLINVGEVVLDGYLVKAVAYGQFGVDASAVATRLFFGLLFPAYLGWLFRQLYLWGQQVKRAEQRQDVCFACGYDMRGTPYSAERSCPECGEIK